MQPFQTVAEYVFIWAEEPVMLPVIYLFTYFLLIHSSIHAYPPV